MHRPGNVDDLDKLKALIDAIVASSNQLPILFPLHPRTAKNLGKTKIHAPNLHLIEPMSYLQFNYVVRHCKAVITDSGGITEEATMMNVPCMTLRDTTERPETVTVGTNELIGSKPDKISFYMNKVLEEQWKKGSTPKMWDGKTSARIVEIILRKYDWAIK